ncbi:hypothetical protein CEX34_13280 [Salmonella enterica]|nr:hypothetical protein [Salmonella enterica]EBA9304298.1 hypothetical protein [Salmonella enterica]
MKITPTSEEFYSSESLKRMSHYCFPQRMTYHEREKLKSFIYQCASNSDIQSLERTLIMIAHWSWNWPNAGWRRNTLASRVRSASQAKPAITTTPGIVGISRVSRPACTSPSTVRNRQK